MIKSVLTVQPEAMAPMSAHAHAHACKIRYQVVIFLGPMLRYQVVCFLEPMIRYQVGAP